VPVADRVAGLATVFVGRTGKLPVVLIFMAIGAGCEFYFVNRCLSGRQMTLGALHLDVFPLERILRCGVLLHAEERGLPTLDGMALGALAFLFAGRELPGMNILVAIHTSGERQGLLEVAVEMARTAIHGGMLAKQRIFGLRMVKRKSRKDLLPTGRGVARFAPLGKRTLVRVEVAIRTSAKLHVLVAGRAAWSVRFVALFASHLNVQPGQRIACLGVIKLLGGLPIGYVVAFGAFVAELAFVWIRMAGKAILG